MLPKHDLLLIDPPYGLGETLHKAGGSSRWGKHYDDGVPEWDHKPAYSRVLQSLECARDAIVWGGQFYGLPVAAIALGRSAPPETSHANLVESSGLNAANQSTAREIAAAARELYYTDIGRISVRQKTEVGSRNSTNPFLKKDGWRFFLSKTGFINRSGGCLVVVMLVNEVPVTVALLGSASKQRWQDLIKIRRMLGDSDFYTPQRVSNVRRHRHL